MAKRRNSKKQKLVKIFAIVGGVLAIIQLGLILYFQSSIRPVDIRDAINEEAGKAAVSDERKAKLRVQLALNHFQETTAKLPSGLEELVPTYFDSIPVDPLTNKPFKYEVQGKSYSLGEVTSTKSTSPTQDSQSGAKQEPAQQKELEQKALIASLDAPPESATFVYDPVGKRDPFRPFDAAPEQKARGEGLTAYDIGQLRLAAIVGDVVSIEDVSGKGYIARKGTKIGLDGGEVVEILSDRIKILETSKDFTGKENNIVKEMLLRNPGDKNVPRR